MAHWNRSIFFLAAALAWASAARSALPSGSPRQKVAVLGFRHVGVDKEVGDLLSEVALTEASGFKQLEVIGESDIAAMLGLERQKQLLGCKEDSNCIAEIGGALGTDYMVIGTVGRIGDLRRLDLKLLDVRKTRVVARVGETIEGKEDRMIAAVQRCVQELLKVIAPAPSPATAVAGAPPSPTAPAAGMQKSEPAPSKAAPAGPDDRLNVHKRLTVQAGQEVLVDHYHSYDSACRTYDPPRPKLMRAPSAGTVEFRPGTFLIGKRSIISNVSCVGEKLAGSGVYYRAGSQAPASDSFHYTVMLGRRVTHKMDVEVEVYVQ